MNTFFYRTVLCHVFCFFLFFSFSLTAQNSSETNSTQPKNELKLDVFQLIVLPGIEITYERLIDGYSSWGITGFVNFDFDLSEAYRYENFEISPFYRFYFNNKKSNNSGFFVQPFLSLIQGEYGTFTNFNYNSTTKERNYFGLAAGALIGRKWVNKKRYSFEITGGVGRLLTEEEKDGYYIDATAYPMD